MEFDRDFILEIFKKSSAIIEGHFKLSSGLHSDIYIQCARINEQPEINSFLCSLIAKQFKDNGVDIVIGPAMGGIIIAYEVARQLGAKAFFAERDETKKMSLRRGFQLKNNDRVLIVEDVITTGGSVKEIIELVKNSNANLIGVGSFINRSGGIPDFGTKFYAVLTIEAAKWQPDECPLCKQNIPFSAPGSKYL